MNQRYLIEFDSYKLRNEIKKEEFTKLKTFIPELNRYENKEDIPWHTENSRYEVELDDFIGAFPDVHFKIVGKVYLSDNKVASEVHQDIQMMKETLNTLGTTIDHFSTQRDMLNFNLGKNPVVINVQNDKLLAINDLIELPEANYGDVQDKLDDGFMIITTYVDRTMGENGDALPTYVLGNYNSTLNAKQVY